MKKFIYILLIVLNFTSCKLLDSMLEGETVYLPGDTLKIYITDTLEVIKTDTLEIFKTDTLEVIKTDTLEVIKTDTIKNNNLINLNLNTWELFKENFKDSLVYKTYGILYLDTLNVPDYENTIFYRFNNIIYQLKKEK